MLDKEAFEQKKYLFHMEQTHNWQVKETLLQIEADLIVLEDFLPKTDEVLVHDHNTDDDILLELILVNMRNATKTFDVNLKRGKK